MKKDIILTILINLFLADGSVLYAIWGIITLLLDLDNDELRCLFITILFVIFTIIKYIALPIWYTLLEKKSKNQDILNFIKKLQIDAKFRMMILYTPLLYSLIFHKRILTSILGFSIYMIYQDNPILNNLSQANYLKVTFIINLLIYFLFVSWFSSYLVLFLYWDIRKKFHKNKSN